MAYEQHADLFAPAPEADVVTRRPRSEQRMVMELIKVLTPHPGGLRRWSVMRAIRTDRERASRDVPQKFEADVERTFRRLCAGAETSTCSASEALFYRPQEKAGEVWAVYPDRAKTWLDTTADS